MVSKYICCLITLLHAVSCIQVTNEIKQSIWLLATETTGPLVQRVTKNIMVVKCKANPKQPLGFLHFAFYETIRNRQQPDYKFQCSCKAFKVSYISSLLLLVVVRKLILGDCAHDEAVLFSLELGCFCP